MANTNAASKIYVCATPQNVDLTEADYTSLTWVQVKGVVTLGETGKSTNVVSLNTWDTAVTDKQKGVTDAGSPELELARDLNDAGQIILNSASVVGNSNKYAFKILRSDAALGGVGTIEYQRGIVAGPKTPNGGNEDFVRDIFTLGFVQEQIIVKPTTAGNPPVNTVAPVISGTEAVGETLTCTSGTFTGDATITYSYQWFANGNAVPGETASTKVLATADIGKVFACRVMAKNDSGTAFGFSNTTDAVVA